MLTVSCDCPAEMIAVLSLITNGCRLWLHGLRGERRANRRLEGLDGQGRLCYVVVRPGWYFRGHHFDSRVLKLRFRFSIFDLLLRPNQVRFMNSRINVSAVPPYEIQSRVADGHHARVQGDGINSEQAAQNLVSQVKFSGKPRPPSIYPKVNVLTARITGLTPLGTALDQKIIQPMLLGPARNNALQKPILVISM
jgi:hypothetical protein